MRRFTTTVLAGCLLLGVPALGQAASARDAGASGGWTDPRPLGRNGVDVDIAANEAGDVVAVWQAGEVIRARFRGAGERWGSVERIGRGHIYDDSVVLTGGGRATVLWADSAGLQVSDRRRNGTWRRDRAAPLVHVDEEGCGDEWVDGNPLFGGGHGRTLFVSWDELGCDEGYSWFAHYAWRLPDGSWTRLRDGAGGEDRHAVAMLSKRRAVLVSTGGGVRVQRLRAGDRVQDGRPLVTYGNYSDVDLVANRHADLALVAASYGVPLGNHVMAMTKPTGEPWSFPHRTPFTGSFPSISIAAGDDGTVIAAVVERGPRARVWAQVGDIHGGRWEGPTAVSDPIRTEVGPVDVAITDDGHGAVVWARTEWPYTLSTHASTRRTGGVWREPVRLAGRSAEWVRPAPNVVSVDGGFTAVFARKAALTSDKDMR